MRKLATTLLVLGLFGCGDDPPPPGPTPTPPPPQSGYNCDNPPTFTGLVLSADKVPGKYIVKLKTEATASSVRALSNTFGVRKVKLMRRGFAGVLSSQAAQALASNPDVQAVFEETKYKALVEPGLDRIDQRDLPLSNSYTPGATGAGVNVAIIDTGITNHPDFGGRLADECFTAHSFCTDGNGHGTHVAGTVGGNQYGVAKGVRLYASAVLDRWGSGTTSDVIQGIEWVVDQKRANPQQAWAANMSLGGMADPPLDQAVCDALANDVVFAIAAGNDGRDARDTSPARVIQAITVGAVDARNDTAPAWTNFGPNLDLFAPGVNVTSTKPGGGTDVLSGTSMATPHVAGAVALYLERHPGSSPAQVAEGLALAATQGKLTNIKNSLNRLLYVVE